ncbi:40S ribosomal protein S20 [Culex quinquefasciatus]|uniref:40S ribosomal protein S20 n=1 Tax=Culex quinquefasciatus TaxID=7176 RepID=B0X612_CULQU|nr:40S ribosomal protein S20 [Culex quinquefasciatus]|eukprot:XP_001865084.1 40S ribosomal protein S20 [Culex quinquefasciatus]
MRLHKRVIDLYSSSEIVKQITTINIKPGVEAVVSIAKIIVIRMVKSFSIATSSSNRMGMVVGTARFITAAATGFGSDSLGTTLVADTSEFMIGAGKLSGRSLRCCKRPRKAAAASC